MAASNYIIRKLKSEKPKTKKEIYLQDQIPALEEIYSRHGPHDVRSYASDIQRYLTDLQKGDENTRIVLDMPFIDSTVSGTTRSKEHVIGKNKFLVENINLPDESLLYHNVYPFQFLENLEDGELRYFTYMIDDDALHLGEFKNIFEFGVGHGYLLRSGIKRDSEPFIMAAGELVIQNNPGKPNIKNVDENEIHVIKEVKNATSSLTFNFESGTYMARSKIDNFPEYKKYLIHTVANFLSYQSDNRMNVFFTEKVIFPRAIPAFSEIQPHLTKKKDIELYKKSILKGNVLHFVVEKDGQRTKFPFKKTPTKLIDAQNYFSTHPYEPIVIFDPESKSYFYNPSSDDPTNFVQIETSNPSQPDMLFGKRRTNKSVKRKSAKRKSIKRKQSSKKKSAKKNNKNKM